MKPFCSFWKQHTLSLGKKINSTRSSVQCNMHSAGNTKETLTLCKLWRIVIDISESNCHGRGPREAAHMPAHIFCLDDNKVLLFGFSVHVWKSSFNNRWKKRKRTQITEMKLTLCKRGTHEKFCMWGINNVDIFYAHVKLPSRSMLSTQKGNRSLEYHLEVFHVTYHLNWRC